MVCEGKDPIVGTAASLRIRKFHARVDWAQATYLLHT